MIACICLGIGEAIAGILFVLWGGIRLLLWGKRKAHERKCCCGKHHEE